MLKKSAMLEMGRVVIGGEGRVQRAIGVCSCCSRVFLASDWWRTNMTVCLVLMRGGKDVIGITTAARDGEPEMKKIRKTTGSGMENRIFNEMTSIFTSGSVCLDLSTNHIPSEKQIVRMQIIVGKCRREEILLERGWFARQ